MFPVVFNLASLNGKNGVVFNGSDSGQSGYSVSTAGDFNSDGVADMIIGAPGVNNKTGAIYMVFGTKEPFASPFNITALNGKNGFVINGISPGDQSGYSVSAAGDVNKDGIDDIIVGAPGVNNSTGVSYIIFGQKDIFPSSFSLTSLNGKNGFVMNGIIPGDQSGYSVSAAGDVNDDSIDDVIIGAPGVDDYAKQSYVVFGNKNEGSAVINLINLNGLNGFALSSSGNSVSGVGDVNNDGISDLLVCNPNGNSYIGQSYVVFGSNIEFVTPFNLTTLNGQNGVIFNGEVTSVSAAGDVNNDGIADMIIASEGGEKIYVVFGSKSGFVSPFNLENLIYGHQGFISYGGITSANAAGDVNDDGIDDIIIGNFAGYSYTGQNYVVFGSAGSEPSDFDNLDGKDGFTIRGINGGDESGYSVGKAGDFNGDGIADFIIGAPGANSGDGQFYIVFGQKSLNSSSIVTETSGNMTEDGSIDITV